MTRFRNANRTCIIYTSSILNDTTLSLYNVIFDHVRMATSTIGSYSYVQKYSSITNTDIGKFCSIAANVTTGPGIHKLDAISTHPCFTLSSSPIPKTFAKLNTFEYKKRVVIGHDVWIGEKAVILDGVKVGNGAVIAAGAIVVKDIAPYSIVGGVPARHIKYRFDEQTINFLQKSKWWNFPDKWFEENIELMRDIELFKKKVIEMKIRELSDNDNV